MYLHVSTRGPRAFQKTIDRARLPRGSGLGADGVDEELDDEYEDEVCGVCGDGGEVVVCDGDGGERCLVVVAAPRPFLSPPLVSG